MKKEWRSRIIDHGEVDPSTLVVNPLNWRLHPRSQEKALTGVLDEIGWVQQVIVNTRTGLLVDGHLRVEAAVKRGESTIPVVYVDLSESEEATILATLDPLAALANSDAEILSELLEKTTTADSHVEALLASIASDSDISLGTQSPGLTDPDQAPTPSSQVISMPGDLWMLGDHKVFCGDSTSASDVELAIGGDTISWMWTDPPYGVDYTGRTSEQLTISNDKPGVVAGLLESVFSTVDAVFEEGSPIYVAHPSGSLAAVFINAFEDVGWHLHQELIWVKDRFTLGHSDYQYQHEPILYGWKGKNRAWIGGRNQSSVIEHPSPSRSADHPSMKPVALIERHIGNSSVRQATGLDPFAGSGSTLIAAERTGRKCIAIELDPQYVDVIVRRWQQHTGGSATLQENGASWLEISEARCGR